MHALQNFMHAGCGKITFPMLWVKYLLHENAIYIICFFSNKGDFP